MNNFKDAQIEALQEMLENRIKHLELCKAVLKRMGKTEIWHNYLEDPKDPDSKHTLYFGVEDPRDLIRACLDNDKDKVVEICPYIEELLPINLSM